MSFSFSGLVSDLAAIGKDTQSVSQAIGQIGGIFSSTQNQFAANQTSAGYDTTLAESVGAAGSRSLFSGKSALLWIAVAAILVTLLVVFLRR